MHRSTLATWTPQRNLTPLETTVKQVPSKDIHQWHIEESSFGHTWRGDQKWEGRGSIVYTRDIAGSVCFGRVMFFFEHANLGNTHTFAFVNWFDYPTEDADSMLYKCDTESRLEHGRLNAIVGMEELSIPLIVARDGDDCFILDFLDKTRCIKLLDWMEKAV